MPLNCLQVYEYLHSCDGSRRKVTYADEMKLKHYIISRDPRALEFATDIFDPDMMGKINDNPAIQNYFGAVVSITLFTRYCVEAGMAEEVAFALSDLFLQLLVPKMSREDILHWYHDMVSTFLTLLPKLPEADETDETLQPAGPISKLVAETINYVHKNLHTALTLKEVASALYVTPDYLSHKFRSEVGITFSKFVRSQKVNIAKLMLQTPEMTLAEIAHNLAFCSQSYFTKVFREETGLTPNNYIKQVNSANK